jgi:hypothetical protein
MKKNNIRLEKLENQLVRSKNDLSELSDYELLEYIEKRELALGYRPTQQFLDEKAEADRSKPLPTPQWAIKHELAQERESLSILKAMSEEELDAYCCKLEKELGCEGDFEKIC